MANMNGAGVIVFIRDGNNIRFLLARSSRHGEWGPPKGHREPGETDQQTARRELFEEVGLRRSAFLPGFRETLTYPVVEKGKPYTKQVVYFLCELTPAEVERLRGSKEHPTIGLATLEALEGMVSHEPLKAVFRSAAEHILSNQPRWQSLERAVESL